jgi:hypothetical protein
MGLSVSRRPEKRGKGEGNTSEEAPVLMKAHPITTNICSDKGDLSHPGPKNTTSAAINTSCSQNHSKERTEEDRHPD